MYLKGLKQGTQKDICKPMFIAALLTTVKSFKEKMVKRQPMDQEKILMNHIYNNRLIPEIFRELLQFSSIKTTNLIKTWAKELKLIQRHTNGLQVYKKVNGITTSQVQIKTTVRRHLTSVRMAMIFKKTKENKMGVGEDTEKSEPYYTTGWNVK